MAFYSCPQCSMSVNTNCGACDAPLEDRTLTLENGSEVRVSECPGGHGKIKSPMCCGTDMACAV